MFSSDKCRRRRVGLAACGGARPETTKGQKLEPACALLFPAVSLRCHLTLLSLKYSCKNGMDGCASVVATSACQSECMNKFGARTKRSINGRASSPAGSCQARTPPTAGSLLLHPLPRHLPNSPCSSPSMSLPQIPFFERALATAQSNPSKVALQDGRTGQQKTYGDLLRDVVAFRSALASENEWVSCPIDGPHRSSQTDSHCLLSLPIG